MTSTRWLNSARKKLQRSDRRSEEVTAARGNHPIDSRADDLALLDTVSCEGNREVAPAIGAWRIVLTDDQVVSRLRLLEVGVIHPVLQNKLELLDDRCLVG